MKATGLQEKKKKLVSLNLLLTAILKSHLCLCVFLYLCYYYCQSMEPMATTIIKQPNDRRKIKENHLSPCIQLSKIPKQKPTKNR